LLHSELKPKAGIETDPRHIYQQAEVDQRPRSLVRAVPPIPRDVRGSASTLRVNLIMLIGMNGQPENVRIAETSGNSAFDAIVAKTVLNEWRFSPAVRRGKKVRVLVEQAFRINFTGGGSPMEARTR
jgi:TonB family protein